MSTLYFLGDLKVKARLSIFKHQSVNAVRTWLNMHFCTQVTCIVSAGLVDAVPGLHQGGPTIILTLASACDTAPSVDLQIYLIDNCACTQVDGTNSLNVITLDPNTAPIIRNRLEE